jgi:hypothetical protein
MKKMIKAVIGAVVAASLSIAVPCHAGFAGGATYNFQTTNSLVANTTVASWPTNVLTTNIISSNAYTVGQFTGIPININYVDEFSVSVQGQLFGVGTNVATNVVGIGFVSGYGYGFGSVNTSPSTGQYSGLNSGPAVATQQTNGYGTNFTYFDWGQTTNWLVFAIPQPAVSNGWFNVQQVVNNTSPLALGNWVGIVAITNNWGTGSAWVCTNFSVLMNQKILVKPFSE